MCMGSLSKRLERVFRVEETSCAKTQSQSGAESIEGIARPGWVKSIHPETWMGKRSTGKEIMTFLAGNNYTTYLREELSFSSCVYNSVNFRQGKDHHASP